MTDNAATDSTQSRPLSGRKVFLVSSVGTTLEYYDFLVYGLAAGLVFNQVFFPDVDPLVGTLYAFAAFGGGFLVRPLGGIVIGHFGDRLGRQPMLILTLLIMGAATFLIGCIPTYDTAGLLAPALLAGLRLVQGFAAGGEFGGAALFGIENAPEGRRGLWGSFTTMGIAAGFLLGSAVFGIVSAVYAGDLVSFAWRIPFWIGGSVALVGLIMRFGLPPEGRGPARSEGVPVPLLDALRAGPRVVLLCLVLCIAYNSVSQIYSTFFLSYLNRVGYTATESLSSMFYTGALQVVFIIGGAYLSDRWGRRTVLVLGGALSACMAFAMFPLVASGSMAGLLFAYGVIAVAVGMILGPIPSFLAEQFSARSRYSGLSLVFQGGGAIGGGTGPVIAVALMVAMDGSTILVSLYSAGMMLLLVVCTLALRETSHIPTSELGSHPRFSRRSEELDSRSSRQIGEL
jgi:MFS family permease